MPTSTIQTNFSAGEISPSLFGRVDLTKYLAGAAKLSNMFVDYRGGVTNRAGFAFVGECQTQTAIRLWRFQFSATQTYCLEFGNRYMRVVTNGGYVTEGGKDYTVSGGSVIVTADFVVDDWIYFRTGSLKGRSLVVSEVIGPTEYKFTLADGTDFVPVDDGTGGVLARIFTVTTQYLSDELFELKFTQSADVLTVTHANHRPTDIRRLANANWEVTPVDFGTTLAAPTNIEITPSSYDGTAQYAYTVTALDDSGQESRPGEPDYVKSGVNIASTKGSVFVTWSPVDGATLYNVYRCAIAAERFVFPDPDSETLRIEALIPAGSAFGYIGTSQGTQFIDSNIVPDFTQTPPRYTNPFANGAIKQITVTDPGEYLAPGPFRKLTATDVTGSGFLGRLLYTGTEEHYLTSSVYIENPGRNYTDPDFVVEGMNQSASFEAEIGELEGNYPRVNGYFQQRKIYASTVNKPQTLWGSKPGAFKNFDVSTPVNDGDSFEFSLVSQEVNYIKHLVQMPKGLVVLTANGAWQLDGGGDGAPLTATNAVATPQAFIGASDVNPLQINYDIVYCQSKGGTVRSLAYTNDSNSYQGKDLSILSNHLFDTNYIIDWAYATEPHKLVWAVRDDNIMLSFTYLKEQEVFAWATHSTRGQFTSVCAVQEGNNDVVYAVVRRVIDGRTVNYLERLMPRTIDDIEDGWFLDCGAALDKQRPDANLSIEGDTIRTPGVDTFVETDVGKVVRGAGGKGTVTAYRNPRAVDVAWTKAPTKFIPFTTRVVPLAAGDWSFTRPKTSLADLWHLEGEAVTVIADGVPYARTVVDGAVTWPNQADAVVVGFAYDCEFQTLPLEANPTVQGKRKTVNAVALKLLNTAGVEIGPDPATLHPVKTTYAMAANGLVTDEVHTLMPNDLNKKGQVYLKQSKPWPISILAITYEVAIGDVP